MLFSAPNNAGLISLRKMEAGQQDRMITIFNLVYHTVKNEDQFTSFPDLIWYHEEEWSGHGRRTPMTGRFPGETLHL